MMSKMMPLAIRRAVVRPGVMAQRRMGYATKAPSATSQFYKQFTRPFFKVLLIAVFSYQLTYWTWCKLETDEIRAERDATITSLEAKVEEYKKSKDADKAAKSS